MDDHKLNRPIIPSWQDVDHELSDLARSFGMGSPTDAWIGQALDELADAGQEISTEAEALAWAEGQR